MIVDCPSCGTGFRLDESALGEAGRRLRCSVCGRVWFQPSPVATAKGTASQDDANEGGAHRDDEEHRGEAPPETPAPAAPAAPATPVAPPAPAPPRQGSGGWGFMLFLLLVIGGIALAVLLSRVLPPFWA